MITEVEKELETGENTVSWRYLVFTTCLVLCKELEIQDRILILKLSIS